MLSTQFQNPSKRLRGTLFMTCRTAIVKQRGGRRRMSHESQLRTTICSKGHTHPPWTTTGVLHIAKCESVCGFCQKETKTAANLRKHVAIHIKNDRLNLTIAEGSSGRGRLEMPATISRSMSASTSTTSTSRMSTLSEDEASSPDPTPSRQIPASLSQRLPSIYSQTLPPFSASPGNLSLHRSERSPESSDLQQYHFRPTAPPLTLPSISTWPSSHEKIEIDHFLPLRRHNLTTKEAWTAIPASEGFKILDLCRSLSTSTSSPVSVLPNLNPTEPRVPCYNRETIYDEEWQTHMKNVHGVFLIWPETWMRKVEVLDLDAFGGDIAVCNDIVMGSNSTPGNLAGLI